MCLFCQIPREVIYENTHVYVMFDKFPVSPGHVLIIPKAHRENYFDASDAEKYAIDQAITVMKEQLDATYQPDGYNIGINNGEAAGQTIFHLHVHLIPRYKDDMDDARGGVRGVIPDKQKYA